MRRLIRLAITAAVTAFLVWGLLIAGPGRHSRQGRRLILTSERFFGCGAPGLR